MYVDIQKRMLEIILKETIGNVRVLEEHWVADEMMYGDGGEIIYLVEVPLIIETYLRVDVMNIPCIHFR